MTESNGAIQHCSQAMQMFIGTKQIKAIPMSRGAYNKYRGWELPADENGADEGYLVEYLDSPNSNHPDHKGYISWSPKDVFDRSHRPCDAMTFGFAIEAMRMGKKVARRGWNGKGMWLMLCVPEGTYILSDGVAYERYPYIYMKTADNKLVPWLASQTDVLAEDWVIVD